MDKDYTKALLRFLAIGLIVLSIFGVKDLLHRREIGKLLLVNPVEETTKTTKLMAGKIEKNGTSNNNKTAATITSKEDVNSDNKIIKTSSNVEKKENTGKDYISDNDAIINTDNTQLAVSSNQNPNISLDNINLLARLIQSEAGDEPYQGKLAVGNVVLYRTNQDNTSLQNTIFKKNQFDGVNTSNFNTEPSEDCVRAATEVLNGKQVLTDGYYFVNLKVASPSWARSDNFIERIGDHWFFRKE